MTIEALSLGSTLEIAAQVSILQFCYNRAGNGSFYLLDGILVRGGHKRPHKSFSIAFAQIEQTV